MIVLLEHPSAGLSPDEAARAATEFRRILERRAVTGLTLTADGRFAAAIAERVLTHDPASGRLSGQRRGWFGRRPGSQ